MIFIINKSYNDMAKKETVKKTAAKKTTKKVAIKKAESIVDNIDTTNAKKTEEEDLSSEMVIEQPELNYEEIYKEEANNITTEEEPESNEEFKEQVMKHFASEILVEKNNDIEEFLSMAEDEMIEKTKEKIEEIKKVNNDRVNNRIDNLFGYLWNGQEMDY